ncbi:MAG: uncharacterized protein JWR16_1783 [Nevskia sp.]|nr:uncharacterized protein [Nevskia sp.]
MFDRLRSLLSGDAASGRAAPSEQLSTALLLLELARADFEIAAVERARVGAMLAQRYGLPPAAAEALMQQAEAEVGTAVSLYDYLKTLNAELDAPGKRRLMEMLWEVAYADGRLDKYEEQLLRKLADLLYVAEKDYIGAKLSVLEQGAPPHG